MRILATTALAALMAAQPALAAVTITSVEVVGAEHVGRETVIGMMSIRPGSTYAVGSGDADLRALYASGLFSNVNFSVRSGRLTVAVTENPVATRVVFEGNEAVKDKDLQKAAGLVPGRAMSLSSVGEGTDRILDLYRRKGRLLATARPVTIDRGQGRVDLVWEIVEGPTVRVSAITFPGAEAFSESTLKDEISTREQGILGWLRSTDFWDPDRGDADARALERFYAAHGYPDARVTVAEPALDRETKTNAVAFRVEEGRRWEMGEVTVESPVATLDRQRLLDAGKLEAGRDFNADAVSKAAEAVGADAVAQGEVFSVAEPRLSRNAQTGRIDVAVVVNPGERVYIERVDVRGNDKTRDYVIRRELGFSEGDALNRAAMEAAERRLRRLGYFETVNVSASKGTSKDRAVVDVVVKEGRTGEFAVTGGYSTADGVIAEVSLGEQNLAGTGDRARASVGVGDHVRNYTLSYTDPWMFGDRVSGGFDVYRQEYSERGGSFRPFSEDVTGGALRLGLPIAEFTTLGLRWSLEDRRVTGVDAEFAPFAPDDRTVLSTASWTLTYDTTDLPIRPREGVVAKLGQDIAGLGGDVAFVRTTVGADRYDRVSEAWDVVTRVGFRAGHVAGLGQDLRFADHFRPGGELVRGFESEGFGPRDAATGYQLGGTMFASGTLEATMPMPLLPRSSGVFAAAFADAGSVWSPARGSVRSSGANVVGDDGSIRASVGVGVMWDSPFGLLRADVAQAIAKRPEDRTQVLRFSNGVRW